MSRGVLLPDPFPNSPVSVKGQLQCLEIISEELRDNYWEDPYQRELWVYTPRGYNHSKKYPLVIFLAGFAGVGEGMLARSLTDISLASRCDRWIAEGCDPFVAVFPDCMTTLGGSQYVDSPAIGNYESHLMKEIIPFMANHFSLTGKVGLAGRSSGGYGAIRLGMIYPELIQGVACHAGDMGFRTAFLGEITAALGPLHQAGSPREFLDSFWRKKRFGKHDFSAFNLLCLSACYSPNLENSEFPAELPIDYLRGEVRMDVFERWMSHDPIEMIEAKEHRAALRNLDFLFLDVGRYDEYYLQFGARIFVEKLKQFGIAHVYEEFDGGHRGTAYRYDHSIPRMIKCFGGTE